MTCYAYATRSKIDKRGQASTMPRFLVVASHARLHLHVLPNILTCMCLLMLLARDFILRIILAFVSLFALGFLFWSAFQNQVTLWRCC